MITRRDAIRSFIGGVLLSDLQRAGSLNAEVVTATGRLMVFQPQHPMYQSILNNQYPGVRELPGYSAVSPYTLVIYNKGAVDLKGYEIAWTAATPSGTAQLFTYRFVRKRKMPRIEDKVLPPGGVRLISPSFNLTPAEYVRVKPTLSSEPVGISLPTDAAIVPLFNAAIFEDGIWGDDPNKLRHRYMIERNAEHDAGVSVLLQANKGYPSEFITESLAKRRGSGSSTNNLDFAAIYSDARHAEAGRLLEIHRIAGMQLLLDRCNELTQYPRQPLPAKL